MNVSKLRELIRELIKTELEEVNSLGASGAGTSYTPGEGIGYMTPFAFKKKRKKK
jgi:hypothetical protein